MYLFSEGLTSKQTNDNVMNIVGNQYSVKKYIGCSFKCVLKVGIEESIVNAPLVSLLSKNTHNAKSEVKFKQLIRDL
jgi:hypothetical protein